MAVYKIFPEKDATIYSDSVLQNTGLDSILEVSTFNSSSLSNYDPEVSRTLIQFSDNDLTAAWNLVGNASNATFLKMFIADASGVNKDTTIKVFPVSSSWQMGTGRRSDLPIVDNGVSWKFSTSSGSGEWDVTGSDYLTSDSSSYTFNYYSPLDLSLNVTDITTAWSSSTYNNYGFVVKQTGSDEFNTDRSTAVTLKYYSRDTHTIYPPCLEFRWDDSSYNTGDLSTITSTPATLTLAENPGVFYSESVNRFRVNARPTYPLRTFQTASYYLNNYALPQESYYAIKDLDTDEYVIDFDSNYTKISCDPTGSYFDVYMNGLEPERYYKILIQTTLDNSTVVYDNDYYFKVVNG